MSKSLLKTDLYVLGVHLNSEGYPNVRYRLLDFRKTNWLHVTESNVPMWKEGAQSRHSKLGFMYGLSRAFYAHFSIAVRYLLQGRVSIVYVPYPSIFVGLFLGLLPQFIRPDRIVLDAFISLYDTVVNDRKLLSPGNWISILLKRLERKAYSLAEIVIVDTPQNVAYLCSEFNLPVNKVVDVPLSTNEQSFLQRPYRPKEKECRVLFVGTFVPLHGVSTILSAAEKLVDCRNIRFRIVGTGQIATELEDVIRKQEANLEWIRAWQTPEALAGMIEEADICLGIFGTGEKTQRVCPFKLYSYAACGRAIITGDTVWTRHVEKDLSYKPFETVPVNDGAVLADRIRKLASSTESRAKLAENSRKFYEDKLCNNIALSKLKALLCDS